MEQPEHELALDQEDYFLPIGKQNPKVYFGVIGKDAGKRRTLIGSVEYVANQTPGPKYDFKGTLSKKSNGFSKEPQRGVVFKQQPKPDPGKYEFSKVAVLPRVLQGVCGKEARKSYIQRVEKAAEKGAPGPKYDPEKPKAHVSTKGFFGSVSEPKLVEERAKNRQLPAPNHYKLSRAVTEPNILQTPAFVSRQKNFIDVAVKKKNWVPPSNQYNLIDLDKISRATKFMSTQGYGRGAACGCF